MHDRAETGRFECAEEMIGGGAATVNAIGQLLGVPGAGLITKAAS
jgi:hypothetical protein